MTLPTAGNAMARVAENVRGIDMEKIAAGWYRYKGKAIRKVTGMLGMKSGAWWQVVGEPSHYKRTLKLAKQFIDKGNK